MVVLYISSVALKKAYMIAHTPWSVKTDEIIRIFLFMSLHNQKIHNLSWDTNL